MNLKTRKKAKLYESEAWLRRKLFVDRFSPEEISQICKVNVKTIYEYMKRFNLNS